MKPAAEGPLQIFHASDSEDRLPTFQTQDRFLAPLKVGSCAITSRVRKVLTCKRGLC